MSAARGSARWIRVVLPPTRRRESWSILIAAEREACSRGRSLSGLDAGLQRSTDHPRPMAAGICASKHSALGLSAALTPSPANRVLDATNVDKCRSPILDGYKLRRKLSVGRFIGSHFRRSSPCFLLIRRESVLATSLFLAVYLPLLVVSARAFRLSLRDSTFLIVLIGLALAWAVSLIPR